MRSHIRVDNKLENGGEVTAASSEMTFTGKPQACQGDESLCALGDSPSVPAEVGLVRQLESTR